LVGTVCTYFPRFTLVDLRVEILRESKRCFLKAQNI
jgi:hypothetical protein